MRRAALAIITLSLASVPAFVEGCAARDQFAAAPAPGPAPYQDQEAPPPPPPDQGPDQGPPGPPPEGYEPFSPDQLDNLLSPIALYPDPLLAQVLVAATFPDQVEDAARFVSANGPAGVDEQGWDVSVKAVAHYPTVIEMMADKIDWTTSVGQAYVNQSTDVSAAIQHLRHMARDAGNLDSGPNWEVLDHDNYIAIDPIQPQFIYVPTYDPAICFYRRPFFGPAVTFGAGYPIGSWLNLDFHWGYGGGWGGVFYTGWHPWGGWNGGWMDRSRPYVRENNFYINERYRNVYVNRTVINRNVNVYNVNRFNYIHRNVTYENINRNNVRAANGNNWRGGRDGGNFNNRAVNGGGFRDANRPPVQNRALNRNMNTADPRINQFRGRPESFGQPIRQVGKNNFQNRPVPNSANNRAPSAPHAFGRSEGNFNSRASSIRGQASRAQMSQPPRNFAPRGGGRGPGGGGGGRGRRP